MTTQMSKPMTKPMTNPMTKPMTKQSSGSQRQSSDSHTYKLIMSDLDLHCTLYYITVTLRYTEALKLHCFLKKNPLQYIDINLKMCGFELHCLFLEPKTAFLEALLYIEDCWIYFLPYVDNSKLLSKHLLAVQCVSLYSTIDIMLMTVHPDTIFYEQYYKCIVKIVTRVLLTHGPAGLGHSLNRSLKLLLWSKFCSLS